MEQFDVVRFAGIEKSHDLHVHQHYAIEVQRDGWTITFNLCREFIQMLRSRAGAQTSDGLSLIGNFLNLQCHREAAALDKVSNCNDKATCN